MPEETYSTIAELAGAAYDQFERRTRENGDAFYAVKDSAPEWLTGLTQAAHAGMLPDDWRYETIHNALGAIHDSGAETVDDCTDLDHEFADGNVDSHNAARTAWLASHLDRVAYCDDIAEEGLVADDASIMDRIGAGQYAESLEVFVIVLAWLAEALEELQS